MKDAVDKEQPRQLELIQFQKWIDYQIKPDKYGSINNLSVCIGMSNKTLEGYKLGKRYGKRGGEINTVSIDVVDKSAIAVGQHISDIYPDYYDWPYEETISD